MRLETFSCSSIYLESERVDVRPYDRGMGASSVQQVSSFYLCEKNSLNNLRALVQPQIIVEAQDFCSLNPLNCPTQEEAT